MGDASSKFESDEKGGDINLGQPMQRARFMRMEKSDQTVVYPEGVQDIAGAAAWLLLKMRKPFFLSCREDGDPNSPYPHLDLSHLQKIYDKKDRLYVSVGATNRQLLVKLTELVDKNLYLNAVLHHNPNRTVLGTLLDEADLNKDLRKNLVALLVATDLQNGVIVKCSLEEFKAKYNRSIIIMTIFQLSTFKQNPGKPFKLSWLMKGELSCLNEIPPVGRLFYNARVVLCKKSHGLPFAVVTADGDAKISLTRKNWTKVTARTKLDYSRQKQGIFQEMNMWKLKYKKTIPIKSLDGLSVNYLAFVEACCNLLDQVVMSVTKREITLCFNCCSELGKLMENAKLHDIFSADSSGVLQNNFLAPAEISSGNKLHFQMLNPNTAHAEPIFGIVIPGFTGAVYDKNHPKYQQSRKQYATSTYEQYMRPEAVAYPDSLNDVIAAIKFAKARNLKVIGRSGGHNYSGVSCDSGALILSMDNFNEIKVYPVDRKIGSAVVKWEAVVGVGVKLDTLSKKLAENELSIPMGECPFVGVGGHAQTGGYGHLNRSFGLLIDFLYQFTIVMADGSIKQPKRDSEDKADRDLFWAVTGGSPGAFGILTSVVLHPIPDRDWPNSTGYKVTAAANEQTVKTALEILEDFVNTCRDSDFDAAPLIDVCMTIGSNFIHGPQHVILFEMVCRDMKDSKAYDYFLNLKKRIESQLSPIHVFWMKGEGHIPLSKVGLVFVRQPPGVTQDGRENPNPYTKACYGTNEKLPEGFSKAMHGLINELFRDDNDTSLIFQVAVGGGALMRNGKANTNALASRDARLWIVFDIFRPNTKPSVEAAKKYNQMFKEEIVEVYLKTKPKMVPLWGVDSDYLDLNKKEIWEKYYDNHKDYYRLREIKATVDPNDLFHSRFTIRPAKHRSSNSLILEAGRKI